MVQLLRDHYGVDERWRFNDTQRPASAQHGLLDAAMAAARIDAATTRDEIVEAFVSSAPDVPAGHLLHRPRTLGARLDLRGEGIDRDVAGSLRIPLDRPSVFQTVTQTRSVFVGRLGGDEEDRRFVEAVGKRRRPTPPCFPSW